MCCAALRRWGPRAGGQDWDRELVLCPGMGSGLGPGPELLPTFACLVSSGVQQEFNYTFDFNENTTSVLRRIYPE